MVVRIIDGVRRLLEIPGLEATIVDLDGRRTLRRSGRPPYRRVVVDLLEARNVLLALPHPDDETARWVVAALTARDLASVREHEDWEVLTARISWALGRLGVAAERAVELALSVVEVDAP